MNSVWIPILGAFFFAMAILLLGFFAVFLRIYIKHRVTPTLLVMLGVFGFFLYAFSIGLTFFVQNPRHAIANFLLALVGIVLSQFCLVLYISLIQVGKLTFRAIRMSTLLLGFLFGLAIRYIDQLIVWDADLNVLYPSLPLLMGFVATWYYWHQNFLFYSAFRYIRHRPVYNRIRGKFQLLFWTNQGAMWTLFPILLAASLLNRPEFFLYHGIIGFFAILISCGVWIKKIGKGFPFLTPQVLYHVVVFNLETKETIHSREIFQSTRGVDPTFDQAIPSITRMIREMIGGEGALKSLNFHSRKLIFEWKEPYGVCCVVDRDARVFHDLMVAFLEKLIDFRDPRPVEKKVELYFDQFSGFS